ncbi:hypothetical protein LCGC14_0543600 [marine sediment metagenome]|uniref:Uncharacterized protein n=1 Tax=marine sediment metagenome TaxID=412755 RepID=A0A0F9UDG8_9ZZZZ
MICPQCKIRWAPLRINYPYEIMTKEDGVERVKIFESDEIQLDPACLEEINDNPMPEYKLIELGLR